MQPVRQAAALLSTHTAGYRRKRLHDELYRRFSPYTMVPRRDFMANLALAERARDVPGAIVECGVWRGGMVAAISSLCGADRRALLFDSFEGLPPAKEIDGESALRWQQATNADDYFDNCSAPPSFAEEAMRLAGVEDFDLVQGWFADSVPNYPQIGPIALLRLDGDWYDSTLICLKRFFPEVAPGGMIIVDDYYTWDGCAKAVHDFLSEVGAVERIYQHERVCYLTKR